MSNLFTAHQSPSEERMLPPASYLPPSAPPTRGGAAAAFKWGAIFGVAAGVVNVLQILASALAVNANLDGINQFETSSEFSTYVQCRASSDPTNCTAPSGPIPGSEGITAVLFAFYGTCFVVFLLTLVIYLFAARAASRESGRRGPGVLAAVVAAVVGSLLYLIGGIVSLALTSRTGLLFGLGPIGSIGTNEWSAGLLQITIIADIVGMVFAVGIGALMGLWGAALGTRGALPPGYPPAMSYGYPGTLPAPGPYPGTPQPPMMPLPRPAPYPGTPRPPMTTPPVGSPYAPTTPDYSLPAQYPPLPSQYEAPPAAPPPYSPQTPASAPESEMPSPDTSTDSTQGGPA